MTEQEQETWIRERYNKARALFREDITNLKNKGEFKMWKYALSNLLTDLRGESFITEDILKKYMKNYNQQ